MDNYTNKLKYRYNNAINYLNSIEMKKNIYEGISNNNIYPKKIVTSLKKKGIQSYNNNIEKKYNNSLCFKYMNYIPNKSQDKFSVFINKTKNEKENIKHKKNNSNIDPSFNYQLGEKTKKKFNDIYSLLIDGKDLSTSKIESSISYKLKEIKNNLNRSSSLSNLKEKTKNSMEKYSKEFQSKKYKKNNLNNSIILKKINPHVDLYERNIDMKTIRKSASCQTIEHMRKVLEYDKKSKTKREREKNKKRNFVNIKNKAYYNNKNNSISFIELDKPQYKNLFESNKVHEHLVDLRHFAIFPKINKRKYNKKLSLKYAENNYIILNDIKDKFINDNLKKNNDNEEEKYYINDENSLPNNINLTNNNIGKNINSDFINKRNVNDEEKNKSKIDLIQNITIDDLI